MTLYDLPPNFLLVFLLLKCFSVSSGCGKALHTQEKVTNWEAVEQVNHDMLIHEQKAQEKFFEQFT